VANQCTNLWIVATRRGVHSLRLAFTRRSPWNRIEVIHASYVVASLITGSVIPRKYARTSRINFAT
jgi:hypothetical protein